MGQAMSDTFDVQPLDATFGAVVTGLKLAEIDDETFDALYRTWLDRALLIFPGQHLAKEEQIAFARRFGPLEFDWAPLSNVRADGSLRVDDGSDDVVKVLKGNMGWHADSTYMPVQAKGAVFSAHTVPKTRGETGWADMRAAYDALDAGTRARIEDLSAYHSLHYSQAKEGHTPKAGSEYSGYGFQVKDPPLRPLVKTHPETGRRTLAIGRNAYGIPGLEPEESERLLDELWSAATRDAFTWYNTWRVGDLVLWDNRCTMHRRDPFDPTQRRIMHRTQIKGTARPAA
jgi:alpha-ketoglutarate-dependent taurine dioxygenase